jgi:hypothetical protein
MKKIIRFGQISENTEGELVFKNFHINFDHQYESPEEGILCMVIERLEIELAQLKILAQPAQERNFCPRCGKRTADLTVIHTCTPPRENT